MLTGFHQCRWGYHNLSVVEDVVENYKKAQIPLDVIWNDDDHMDGHKDFTLNPNNYPRPKLLAFLEKIHSIGMKYIVIIDPGIGVNSSYGVYQRGIVNDVFIKYQGEPYLAQVWPGAVNFPDFLNPKTVEWWGDEIRRFHELVPVDGLWIDMNEASNFCSGLCKIPKDKQCPSGTGPGWVCCLDCKNITETRWDDPPYKINASGLQVPIGYKTIATSAVHYNGVLEYDAHSIYGFSQAIATHKALQDVEGKRPFILSRSTYVGSGKYAAHWTGDNQGTWEDLKYSISTMINFGIFGVPMVGSDICGFYPAPTEELCNRWIEVGAFYPFSRDHANYYSPRQELYQWEFGGPIRQKCTWHEITVECYGLSTQFLLGRSLMISPVLEQGKSQGGLISKEARMTPFTLLVTFPAGASDGKAAGKLFLDDDELQEMKLASGSATYVDFYATVSQGTVKLWSEVQESKFALDKGWKIGKVTVLGLGGSGAPSSLEVEGEPVTGASNIKLSSLEQKYMTNSEVGDEKKRSMMVEVGGLEIPVGKNFTMSWKMGSAVEH
ncbi:ALPHA-GLUCOSIDASE [Salix koriyanagi]|uniref:ALPHA-GLUCOSIDASE n=1 Tax=Salix koriyanagi TaxID=2511006 RepID=A0A9Q0WT36_9ROSI|nr:ALPHA-GLUCOSIDASE [Salix koriyanagi]